MVPAYMNEETQYNRHVTARTLRNADDFRLPRYNKSYTQNSMWYEGLKLFSSLPSELKDEPSLNHFKVAITAWLKEKFPV
jgi:hypothetical protein